MNENQYKQVHPLREDPDSSHDENHAYLKYAISSLPMYPDYLLQI